MPAEAFSEEAAEIEVARTNGLLLEGSSQPVGGGFGFAPEVLQETRVIESSHSGIRPRSPASTP